MPSGAKKVKFFVIVARILSRRVWIRARSLPFWTPEQDGYRLDRCQKIAACCGTIGPAGAQLPESVFRKGFKK